MNASIRMKDRAAEFQARERATKQASAAAWREHLLTPSLACKTVGDVLDAYLAAKGNIDVRGLIETWVRPAFGDMAPEEVGPREIEAWLSTMRRAHPAKHGRELPPKTERSRYSAIRAPMAWAEREGLIEESRARLPLGVLGPNRVRSNFDPAAELPTVLEFRRVITSSRIPLDRRLDYALAGAAGLRSGERHDLRFGDIDFSRKPNPSIRVDSSWSRKEGRVKPTKTKIAREVPAHLGCVVPLLREWMERGWFEAYRRVPGPKDILLPRFDRDRWLVHRNDRQALKRWHKDLKTLGLKPRRLHALRHFFCTVLVRSGADIKAVERLTHPTPRWRSSEIYIHSSYEWLCETVQKLELEIAPGGDR
jgi:integrase